MNEKETNESLVLMGIQSELIPNIQTSIESNQSQIKVYLSNLKVNTVEYKNLEWRVDVKLASRAIKDIIEPEIILKLDLKNNNNDNTTTSKLLKTDIVNLVHLTNSLDDALNEIKTNYCRRVFRNVV